MLRLGEIESKKGNMSRALGYYSDALALNPKNPIAWFMVGNEHLAAKANRAARKSFEKVLEINKYDSYALCSAGNLCLIFARGERDAENVFFIVYVATPSFLTIHRVFL